MAQPSEVAPKPTARKMRRGAAGRCCSVCNRPIHIAGTLCWLHARPSGDPRDRMAPAVSDDRVATPMGGRAE